MVEGMELCGKADHLDGISSTPRDSGRCRDTAYDGRALGD
jgi:hypothetical protein